MRETDNTSLGQYEYTPYGEAYAESGASITYKFTGKAWEPNAQMYYFPYRYYSPAMARWLTRDPSAWSTARSLGSRGPSRPR